MPKNVCFATPPRARTPGRVRRVGRGLLAIAAVLTVVAPGFGWFAAPVPALAATSSPYVNGHPSPAVDVSGCGSKAAGGLCVRAAQDSILPGSGGGMNGQGPSKNDPVTHFKWLLNKDNTGGVTMAADGKTPIVAETTKCHPITSTFKNGNPNYPYGADGSGPLLIDGSPNPAACSWPSVHNITSSPVVSTGNDNDWNAVTALPKYVPTTKRGLPDGKYLVSVTANGYQIGGGHFTVAGGTFGGLNVNNAGVVVVSLNPLPIPLANIRLKVYGDMASTNGQWDEQSEFGLPNFDGRLVDYSGPVNVDYYNNPLCTAYQLVPAYTNAVPDPTDAYYRVKLALDGRPVIDAHRHIRGSFEVDGPSTGQCTSDGNGDILMPNLAPNRYAASVTTDKTAATDPVTKKLVAAQQTCSVLGTTPDHTQSAVQDQACWVQTTTLEGNHDFDAWPQANSTGYDTELLVGGELVPQVQFGFVRAGCMADVTTGKVDFAGLTDPNGWLPPNAAQCATLPRNQASPIPTGAIKGHIMGAAGYFPGIGGLPGTATNSGTAGYKFDRPVRHPWVTVSDLNNGDKTVWASNANLDGSFQVNGVPDGSYSVAVWDQMQDYIFDSFNVTVSGGKVADVGVVPLLEWWTRITGRICIDTNGNGRCDPGEAAVPKFVVQNLNRTNNAQEGGQNTVVTDDKGQYQFTEAYPLGYNDVIQAFNTRWKTTGVTWQACNDPLEHTTLTAVVDVQYNPVIAQCGRLDWAVQPYAASSTPQPTPYKPTTRADNGGIVATVFYDSVRNRFSGRAQPAQSFFTGIPGVLTELFKPAAKAPDSAVATQLCGTATVPNVSFNHYYLNCDGSYKTSSTLAAGGVTDGGYATTYASGAVVATDRYGTGTTVNAYQTEHYGRGTGCVARDANGKIISGSRAAAGNVVGTEPNGNTVTDFLPGLSTDPASANPGHYTQACIEAPATGVNFSLGTDNLPLDPGVPAGATHGVQTVDGNYALTPTDAAGKPAVGDFLVKADIPGDQVLAPVDGADRPLYKVADETSMNNFAKSNLDPYTGDLGTGAANQPGHATTPQFVPQNADLTRVFNLDGTEHTDLGTCGTQTCTSFSFPPQAGKPSQTPVAQPVTGGDSPSTYVEDPNTSSPGPDPQCAGPQFKVTVTDPGFLSVGGSPLEGQVRNSCDIHLIHVGGGQSVAPNFYLYTDVPLPTTFIIQNFDDTNLSTNKTETQYGDAAPIPNSPEGVYDWHGNLAYQTNVDPNGIAEALMPSSDVADCVTPSGICQNIYRFVGNDPGTIDHPNVNYDPQFQTITANFQALPGVFTPADTAPIRSALAFINGGQKFTAAARCALPGTSPQLFSVDRPYTDSSHGPGVVIKGLGFGATQGQGAAQLSLAGTPTSLSVAAWSDTEIRANVPAGTAPAAYQLSVTNAAGRSTVNGITYHVIGSATSVYHPAVLEVDPSFSTEAATLKQWQAQRKFPSIQEAIERAAGYWLQPAGGTLTYRARRADQLVNALVVVYPAAAAQQSPANSAAYSGVWYEPIIIHSAVTVQGVGPGGVVPATAATPTTSATPAVGVPGTVIDGRYYFSLTDTSTAPAVIDWANAPQDVRAQHAVDVWQAVATASFPKTPAPDNRLVTEGQNVTVLGQNDQAEFTADVHPVLDGFGLQSAITINTPFNVHAQTGQRTGPAGGADATQGGAIYLNGHDDWTQVTNNVINGNSGSYGAIRIGSPQLDGQHNWNVEVGNNQIVANGGNNLGGALAIFNDAGGYRIHDNLICGNQSAEYGGGLSQYGLSVAPVGFTAKLVGNTLTTITAADGGATAFPFTAADRGRSVAGLGLRGVTVRQVDSTKQTVTLAGSVNANAWRGSFQFVPSTVALQTNANLIDHNTIKFNQSQDEGGGIMIAGQLPADVTKASPGAGPVKISGNTITINAANDDGGGIRFLMAGNSPMRVENNFITNNVSSHEGGGIALDDTSKVTVINNTIAKNVTTATAATSNGTPAPAGISTAHNSAPFQARLDATAPGSPAWSNPLIVNDIIYDNRAGSWNASTSNVTGIGLTGDASPLNIWDVGIADAGPGQLSPLNSLLSTAPNAAGGEGYLNDASNKLSPAVTATSSNYPNFADAFDLHLQIAPMRINFRFRSTAIVNIGLPDNGVGDYHVRLPSPGVVNTGTARLDSVQSPYTAPITAPNVDIDGRPRSNGVDAGATQTAVVRTVARAAR